MTEQPADGQPQATIVDRMLRVFSDVRAGESTTVLLLCANLFVPLVGYYILKVVREALIQGAADAAYATAAQALLLMVLVPLYGWFASKVPRNRLIVGVVLFFVACIQLFFVGQLLAFPNIGIVFFVWVGIFSLMIIAQFWSFANDVYDKEKGERLFPVIAVGQTVGALAGAQFAGLKALSVPILLQISAGLLMFHLVLYWVLNRRPDIQQGGGGERRLTGAGGFTLVLRSPYLRLVALVFLLLNLVNTTGEYILRDVVNEQARLALAEAMASDPSLDQEAFLQIERKAFYGDFFTVVNLATVLIQAFLVSRIVKFFGIRGVLFALPLISLSAYSLVALGAGFSVLRWAKTAENSTDYSVMNTGRAMLWLPTSRDEKYKAKQAIDTFVVRLGDLLSGALVYAGTEVLRLTRVGFANANVVLVLLWLGVTWLVVREYRELSQKAESPAR